MGSESEWVGEGGKGRKEGRKEGRIEGRKAEQRRTNERRRNAFCVVSFFHSGPHENVNAPKSEKRSEKKEEKNRTKVDRSGAKRSELSEGERE